MLLNEKIHMIRKNKKMSLAEIAFKSGYTIEDIICFETKGTKINGYALLKILNALEITINDFEKLKVV